LLPDAALQPALLHLLHDVRRSGGEFCARNEVAKRAGLSAAVHCGRRDRARFYVVWGVAKRGIAVRTFCESQADPGQSRRPGLRRLRVHERRGSADYGRRAHRYSDRAAVFDVRSVSVAIPDLAASDYFAGDDYLVACISPAGPRVVVFAKA